LQLAVTEKLAEFPAVTIWLTGCDMSVGAVCTVSVAAEDVTDPTLLVISTA
jgi:hypothetical protein